MFNWEVWLMHQVSIDFRFQSEVWGHMEFQSRCQEQVRQLTQTEALRCWERREGGYLLWGGFLWRQLWNLLLKGRGPSAGLPEAHHALLVGFVTGWRVGLGCDLESLKGPGGGEEGHRGPDPKITQRDFCCPEDTGEKCWQKVCQVQSRYRQQKVRAKGLSVKAQEWDVWWAHKIACECVSNIARSREG